MDVVTEEDDLDEFVELETQAQHDEHENDARTRHNTPDENATEIGLKTDSKKFLYGEYYRIIEKNGDNVCAECKSCKLIVNDWMSTSYNKRYHLKVC